MRSSPQPAGEEAAPRPAPASASARRASLGGTSTAHSAAATAAAAHSAADGPPPGPQILCPEVSEQLPRVLASSAGWLVLADMTDPVVQGIVAHARQAAPKSAAGRLAAQMVLLQQPSDVTQVMRALTLTTREKRGSGEAGASGTGGTGGGGKPSSVAVGESGSVSSTGADESSSSSSSNRRAAELTAASNTGGAASDGNRRRAEGPSALRVGLLGSNTLLRATLRQHVQLLADAPQRLNILFALVPLADGQPVTDTLRRADARYGRLFGDSEWRAMVRNGEKEKRPEGKEVQRCCN